MSSKRYAEEFKMEAVKQITERRYTPWQECPCDWECRSTVCISG